MANPLLLDRYLSISLTFLSSKKFDLRVYVLLFGPDPLEAFIADEGLVRFCTENYEKPTKENMKNMYMHLTNYSLNKMSDKYVNADSLDDLDNASKRTFAVLRKNLEEQGHDYEEIWDKIKEAGAKVLQLYDPAVGFKHLDCYFALCRL